MLKQFYETYKHFLRWTLLLLFCVLEFGLISKWRPQVEADANMIQASLLFILGVAIGLYALWMSLYGNNIPQHAYFPKKLHIPIGIIIFLLPLLSLLFLLPTLSPLFEKYAIAPQNSDIIPQIEIMARRFMQGEFPYAPIHDFGYELRSPYMPMHWGPFIIPEYFQFDDRWWVLTFWGLSYLFFSYTAFKKGKNAFQIVILSILPGLFMYKLLESNFIIFSHTVELLILSYYFLLISALNKQNIGWISLGILACLLSRYSLLFWTPLFFLPFLVKKQYKKLGKSLGIVLGGILLLYIFPFLSQNWHLPFEGLEHHGIVTLKNWTFEPWFGPNAKPGALYRGTGLAAFFYEYWPGDAQAQLSAVQGIQLGGSAILLLLFSLIYVKNHQRIQLKYFFIGTLKLMLTFFYSFLALPIDYYFIVPVFMSLGILLAEVTHEKSML